MTAFSLCKNNNLSFFMAYVFVPVEYPELAEEEEIQPYQSGLICAEWLELELVEPSEHN
jgi:hypothetical protein